MNFGQRGIAGDKIDLSRRMALHSLLPYAGAFANLVQGNAGAIAPAAPNTQVRVTADVLCLDDGAGNFVALSAFDVTASTGALGVNGLDTGTIANSTWYATWAIYNPVTRKRGVVLSTSAAAPSTANTPGYTFRRRTGWVRVDGSGNLLRTLQNGRRAAYSIGTNPAVAPVAVNGVQGTFSTTAPVLASVSLAAFVPPTATAAHILASNIYTGATASNVLVAPNTTFGGANNGPNGSNGQTYPIYLNASVGSVPGSASVWLALEALSFGFASSNSGGAASVLGWEDNL